MMERSAEIIGRMVLQGNLKLLSPLLIGSGQDDNLTDTLVLRDKNNCPYIPGTSLAGVLRSLDDGKYAKYFGVFGEGAQNDYQSIFVISDISLDNADIVVRDSVRIDEDTGVSAKGAKFDYEAVERGAEGTLKITAVVRKFQENEKDDIKAALKNIGSRLQDGIHLGALTRRGFGKVVCTDVLLDDYEFSDPGNVAAWLLRQPSLDREKVQFAGRVKASDTLVLSMDLRIKNSLIVRTGDFDVNDYKEFFPDAKTDEDRSAKHIDSVQMCSRDDFVIPGATVRGIIRNQARKIMNVLGKETVWINNLFGFSDENTKQRGRLIAEETYFSAKNFKQSRNKIDRFTGGTIDSALFTEIPVLHTKESDALTIRVEVERCKDWEAGLLLLIAKDICTGQVAFGGEKSVGRGVMEGIGLSLQYKGKDHGFSCVNRIEAVHPGDMKILEQYVQAFLSYEGGRKN